MADTSRPDHLQPLSARLLARLTEYQKQLDSRDVSEQRIAVLAVRSELTTIAMRLAEELSRQRHETWLKEHDDGHTL